LDHDVFVCDSPWTASVIGRDVLAGKLIATCHSFVSEWDRDSVQRLHLDLAKPDLVIVTSDDEVCQIVNDWGHKAVHIPISIDTSCFSHTPYPEEFTIGYLGGDLEHKRFDLIEQVGAELGVKVFGSKRKEHVGGEFVGKRNEFYSNISCYVCATTCEKAPFPTLEAMICGRPLVVTPQVTSPPNMIARLNAGAGVVTDDIKEGIMWVKDNFEQVAAEARKFEMVDTSKEYEDAILGVLE
jgi:glycosyltransferase involved in cell wall biosynthesis